MYVVRIVMTQNRAPAAPAAPAAPSAPAPLSQEGAALKQQIAEQMRAVRDAQREVAADIENQVRVEDGVVVGGRGAPNAPGHTMQPPFNMQEVIPPQVVDIAMGFFIMCATMVIGWPLARAFGRRLERSGQVAAVSPAMAEQMQRIEQAVDAMSIEIERISESQRFMAKLQNAPIAEQAALRAGERR